MKIDSTSGQEAGMIAFITSQLQDGSYTLWAEDGNILVRWGDPQVVFCSHMDTVPPYIPPRVEGDMIYGRGACDAKGQIDAMWQACRRLEAEGLSGFGLLLVSGEETGSFGAKAATAAGVGGSYLIIGEPTCNIPVSACKGTKGYELTFTGKPFHSGYPQYGVSAVDLFVRFMNELQAAPFAGMDDPVLGQTTWNVGRLSSDNPQNILSPSLTCRLYFRTTFATDAMVVEWMAAGHEGLSVKALGGDSPAPYFVPEGFEGAPVSFGSDAPHLSGFAHRTICGPGTIKVAHTSDECISRAELEQAVDIYVRMFKTIRGI